VSLKQGLAPVVGPAARLLVLGSLPGDASLSLQRYYGHLRNLFWRLMGEVMDEPLEAAAYEARLDRLAARGVGLWDVVAHARRPGSLDAAMREVGANDLVRFVQGLPEVRAVGFNGGTAAKIGATALAPLAGRLELIALPSSSPAFAAMSYPEKVRRWSALKPYVGPAG
jgi:hypoxanthine-DNA glycosylase